MAREQCALFIFPCRQSSLIYFILSKNRQVMKSINESLMEKITQQMDTISTKVGEAPALDKMVNLLSVLKAQDRKYSANEVIMEVG